MSLTAPSHTRTVSGRPPIIPAPAHGPIHGASSMALQGTPTSAIHFPTQTRGRRAEKQALSKPKPIPISQVCLPAEAPTPPAHMTGAAVLSGTWPRSLVVM